MREIRDSLIRSEKIFQIGLIIIVLSLSYIVLSKLTFLFSPFLWAITFYLTLKPFYIYLIEKKDWKKHLAASFLVLLLLLFILIFLMISYLIINIKVLPLLENPNLIKDSILLIVNNIQSLIPVSFDAVSYVSKLIPEIANYIIPFVKNIGTLLLDIFFTLIIFYIFLIYNNYIRGFMEKALPFKKKSSEGILDKFENLVRGNMISIPLVAIAQGISGLIGYWIFGLSFGNALIFGFLTFVTSIIPIIGTAIIYIPLAIYIAFVNGSLINGLGIFLWGFILIGFVDNLARAFFQRKISQISEWYTILGTIVGIKIFGLSGLIFGPILLILVISLWKLYYEHFGLYREDYIKDSL